MGSGKSYRNLLVSFYLALSVSLFVKPQEASCQVTGNLLQQDTTRKPVLKLDDVPSIPWEIQRKSPLFLNNPSNFKEDVVYDPEKNEYIIYRKIGSLDYRPPVHMNPEEFRKYDYARAMREYWNSRIAGEEAGFRSTLIPQIEVGGAAFDKIFGSNIINIIPQGSAELIFGVNISHTENPILTEKLRTIPTFDFKEKIQMNVTGTIGDKMELGVNYNTDAMFEFENRTKLQYSGKEDEIIRKIEAGDVTLPLKGTLITGSYSLFGLKTEMQFGKLTVTTVLSQQKGETSVIQVEGGAQQTSFEIFADEYEGNRHFFLSQYFRDIYDDALKTLPIVSSGVNIERIEVWITNKTSRFEEASNRNIVAFMDLAENRNHIFNSVPDFQAQPGAPLYPANDANRMYDALNSTYTGVRDVDQVTNTFDPLYPGFQIGRDFEKIENARRLNEREFTVNKQLGYISLNTALNTDEVLAVAYEYTLNGKIYKVGEFSTDGITAPQTLVLKLIKGTTLSPRVPTWDLMMKNIYALGSGRLDRSDFQLNVLYQDDKTGNSINYLPEGNLQDKILLQVMGLDYLNSQSDREPDGYFDFIEGVTVMVDRGKIVFPVIEPFGSHLRKVINNEVLAARYVFQELYDSTQTIARQMAEKNKFLLNGVYSSESGSEIQLNAANIPQGSVVVTAGGVTLTENTDYTVDYNMGTVRIINSALIESQTPIQVSLESNQFFGFQTKTLLGTHLNYRFSNNFDIGGTILHLNERPYTQKVNFGEEPISNTIWGLNSSYRSESQLLTKIVDKIPFLETKAPSAISFFGEFANLIPGHSRAISSAGNSYIDDFEASEIPLDLKSFNSWTLASIPQGQDLLFPEARLNNNITSGFNRAKMAWYVIDPIFLRNGSSTPDHIKRNPDEQSSHFVREIFETEIFPYKESPSGIPTNITVLNLAYYPGERGPYNFDTDPGLYSAGINSDGTLNDPASRWGGIMREVLTSDFETANIQYIKFWLMDPFVEDPEHEGGDLYINLGNISEDILRDSRKSFENGLPGTPSPVNIDTTVWGRVPTVQSVVNAFDNDPESRRYQDVGFDGLRNEDEQTFFSDYVQKVQTLTEEEAFQEILKDPAGDNFHYFRGSDYDFRQLGILERYKKYNGPDGNSPTSEMSEESYPTSSTTLPDMEDINRDNTLSETESYYQYRVSMRPGDLAVGRNYVVDEIEYEATFANGTKSKVKWYQLKIPITDYQKVIGNISDFKSVRFMRLYARGFSKPVIMRFAKLDLVRAEWRKYNLTFMEGGERITVPEAADGTFEISSVSIEENAGKEPVNYVLPPGFTRITDPSNPQLRQLNEQSMVLKVQNLEDGDARAAFKNVNLDIRQYRNLRMEVHAEAIQGQILNDNELTAFIRIGSDYKSNFYEYEIPLKLTAPGRYDNKSDESRALVWPEENSFNIDLSVLQDAKQERNRKMMEPGSSLSVSDVYVYMHEGHRISVSGNPNMSNVKVIMVGVRNPIKTRNPSVDDGYPKWGEIWVNELRLSDFIENGGWAANAHLQARLADFGTIDMVGQTSTPGWGSIEKKVNERSKQQVVKYDLSSTLEFGKFFNEDLGVRLPLYMGYSETRIKPQYNPLDPDIFLSDALKNSAGERERDSIRAIAEDFARRKTLTVSNAGITKRGEKPHPWDLANLSVNYTYNEVYRSDTKTEIDLEKNYRGGITYDYQSSPKNVMPFKNVRFLSSPVFRVIKDFNFYIFPRSISFRTDISRYYNEIKTRNINNPYLRITPTFRKDFEWSRIYDFKYDVTRQLKVDFTATNLSRIDEPEGGVDRERYGNTYDLWRDSVMNNILNFGRNTNYNHFLNVTYTLPVNKLPLLSWINSNLRYGSDYTWLAGPLYPDSMKINIGNSIKNHNELTFTAQGNLASLYSKVGFLKKIENNTRPDARTRMQQETRTVTYTRENVNLRENIVRVIVHSLKTRDVKVTVTKKTGEPVKGKVDIINENRVNFTSAETAEAVTIKVDGQVPVKRSPFTVTGEYLVRALMGVRNVSLTVTSSQGQFLPGYMPGTKYAGMSDYNDALAPGWPFILGYSDTKFFDRAAQNGWLSKDSLLNTPATASTRFDISARSMVEPFPGMRIDVNADRRFQEVMSAYYIADFNGNFPDSTRNRIVNGNFSISVISWGTAFEKISKDNEYLSPTFEAFKENLIIISERRAAERREIDPSYDPDTDPLTGGPIEGPFKNGYGMTSREVMIPAFIAAYTKSDPHKVTLETFPSALRMMPNWRLQFDGLSRFAFIQRWFRSVNISHQYRSTYQIGNYTTNLNFSEGSDGLSKIRDLQNNFIQQYEINVVSINEQFSPLINVDMNWKNSLTTRFEWKKQRTVSLNLTSNQIADARVNELIVGAGYRFDDVRIAIRTGGTQKTFRSDLNVRLDLSIRDDKTVARKLVENVNQPVVGQKKFTAGLTADYVLSDRFNLQIFADHTMNNPFVANTFPTSNTNVGFSLKFTLVQ
ncbi:MAG TPA: cell surface protein SprA [Bacteroidales bacterium]|nr:cell surface protein SprA [Bacteroidales bacterium]HPF01851.1 cell surface protein SprA [Bacteroidales bacterium]HPR11551.1 cell surface protein SprA [Bacteroidales bacterium]HRW84293.1 cell surface protein SprA [Bacteroidales bacterium]